MPSIAIEKYYYDDDSSIKWKGLSVNNPDHLELLQDFAIEHMSPEASSIIGEAVERVALNELPYAPRLFLQHQLDNLPKDYIYTYLRIEFNKPLDVFYNRYGILEPDDIFGVID